LDGMSRIETQVGETLEQQADGDLRRRAGKRRPQAKMRTAAKGEVARVLRLDIEAVRIGGPRRVVAGYEKRRGDLPQAPAPAFRRPQAAPAPTDGSAPLAGRSAVSPRPHWS